MTFENSGGQQVLSLAVDCVADYIVWHEVMHAIGFEHEHQRPDRDDFIRVEYANVQAGQMGQFSVLRPLRTVLLNKFQQISRNFRHTRWTTLKTTTISQSCTTTPTHSAGGTRELASGWPLWFLSRFDSFVELLLPAVVHCLIVS